MPHQRELQKQACLGALGVGAVIGLPQLFVQPLGAVSRAGPAPTAPAGGPAALGLGAWPQVAGASGAVHGLGLGLTGVTVLAAGAARAKRCSKTAPAARQLLSPLKAFEDELGVQPPVGFWDPVGFTKDGDEFSFKRRRSVEIKHGRICMLATMGYITPEITGKFPGYISPSSDLKFEDIPNGLAAISKVPGAGWAQIVAYFGYCEFSGGFDDYKTGTPGDYGWKVLTSENPEEKTKKLAAEIANGRLAMMAIIGMFFQDGLTGSAWGDWASYTDSPLRAFESELGVQSPFGFWDPAGFTADGDVEAFKRRRVTELKHGRVSMLATLGYMVPEGFKFDGYLSPSEGIQFSDVPHGLSAISKVPAAGWAQILAFAGFIELVYFKADPKRAPGDYENAGVLGFPDGSTITDPEEKKRRLNAELANGRLAMTAILALFFQNGTVGTTGPEMWLGGR